MGHRTSEATLTEVNLLVGNMRALRKTRNLYFEAIRRIIWK